MSLEPPNPRGPEPSPEPQPDLGGIMPLFKTLKQQIIARNMQAQARTFIGNTPEGFLVSGSVDPKLSESQLVQKLAQEGALLSSLYEDSPFGERFLTSKSFRIALREQAIACARKELISCIARDKNGPYLIRPDLTVKPVNLNAIDATIFTVTGLMHVMNGTACQDVSCLYRNDNCVILTVCDGSSACPLSAYGARLLAQDLTHATIEALSARKYQLRMSPSYLGDTHIRLLARYLQRCKNANLAPECGADLFFASTAIQVVVTDSYAMGITLGDGFVQLENTFHDIKDLLKREDIIEPGSAGGWGFDYCPSFRNVIAEGLENPYNDALEERGVHRTLHDEARAFKVLFFLPTCEFRKSGVTVTTDGLRHSDDEAGPALDTLVRHGAVAPDTLSEIIELAGLYYGYQFHEQLSTQRTKQDFFKAIVKRSGALRRLEPLAPLVTKVLETQDEAGFTAHSGDLLKEIETRVDTLCGRSMPVVLAADDFGYGHIQLRES